MLWPRSSAAISPTGHYTGYTWVRAGLSDPALATTTGRIFYDTLRLPLLAAGRLGLPTLDALLLARHTIIDALLEEAVTAGRVGQVVELASGLSARGLRFTRRHPELTYIEADLPGMVATKRQRLAAAGELSDRHHVVEVDAFAVEGPTSLAALVEPLARDEGLAVITEGLLNYFSPTQVTGLWRRVAATLDDFASGLYLADLVVPDPGGLPLLGAGVAALGAFVGGRVHAAFDDERLLAGLEEARFGEVTVHRVDEHPAADRWRRDPATRLVRIIEAS